MEQPEHGLGGPSAIVGAAVCVADACAPYAMAGLWMVRTDVTAAQATTTTIAMLAACTRFHRGFVPMKRPYRIGCSTSR